LAAKRTADKNGNKNVVIIFFENRKKRLQESNHKFRSFLRRQIMSKKRMSSFSGFTFNHGFNPAASMFKRRCAMATNTMNSATNTPDSFNVFNSAENSR